MAELSAGILLYRRPNGGVEVLLIHPGGPYWRNRDAGAWMIPKGGVMPGEDAATAAAREFEEELGVRPEGEPVPLCRIRQSGGKWVEAFALEGDFNPARLVSNSFEMEWPPRSGRIQSFPEADAARWFRLAVAREMMLVSQLPLLDCLEGRLAGTRLPTQHREVPDGARSGA
jgi:predicted NUDIX family NTP pyrophosphohydrolase